MKQCPQCRRVYGAEVNFCLDDGFPLTSLTVADRPGASTETLSKDAETILGELLTVEYQIVQAQIKGDVRALSRLFADEYWGADLDGNTDDKPSYIQKYSSGVGGFSINFEDTNLIAFDNKWAVLSLIKFFKAPNYPATRWRDLDVFIFRETGWQLVCSHAGKVL